MLNVELLKIEGLQKSFGGLQVLTGVSLGIEEKEIRALIGPNGAGKTTLFNIISGLYKPDTGKVILKDENITGMSPHRVCKKGIARTFQNPKPISGESVFQNVLTALMFNANKSNSSGDVEERAHGILEFMSLADKRDHSVNRLTIATLKKLEIARGIACSPDIILLDEVLAGLTNEEMDETMDLIREIRDRMRITIFLIEHVMRAVTKISDRMAVLYKGDIIVDGKPKSVVEDKKVIEAYLGEEKYR